ncbi:MAG: nucleotidyltransferase family protein [Ktedonobacteraceae bacterium]
MPNSTKTAAIILAGGTSSRMGEERNKLLLPLDNQPVLAHVVAAALGSQAHPIVLVLGYQAQIVQKKLKDTLETHDIVTVQNLAYQQGQSTSMHTGLRALRALPESYTKGVDAAIFLLGDQPMLTSALIDKLLALRAHTDKRIILPLYQGKRGNPVIFSLDLAPELFAVTGDEGGRSVLKRHPNEIATLEIGAETANFDVDTWEAYLKVQGAWQQHGLE